MPIRPGLAPDRLAERQRGRQRRGGGEVDRVPGDSAGVVVLDQCQPRPGRAARRGDHPQVQQGVVGLPDLVRPGRFAAVHQVEHLLVPFCALVRERGHRRVDAPHDVVDRGVAGYRPPLAPGLLRPPGGAPWRRSAADGAARGLRSSAATRTAFADVPCPTGPARQRPGPLYGRPPASGAACAQERRARPRHARAGSRPRGGSAAPASGQAPAPAAPRAGRIVRRAYRQRYSRRPPHGQYCCSRIAPCGWSPSRNLGSGTGLPTPPA